jgi:hypothetical protein
MVGPDGTGDLCLCRTGDGMSDVTAATDARRCGDVIGEAGCAIVLGGGGRVGGAFARRLREDGFLVLTDPADPVVIARSMRPCYLFDCAYRDGDPEGHVERVGAHLRHWRDYAAIFVPSSSWIDGDHGYARAKRVVEALAAFYTTLGARIVTDRIGYFPGDGVVADPTEPLIGQLVDGDTLYRRVMARMLEGHRVPAT